MHMRFEIIALGIYAGAFCGGIGDAFHGGRRTREQDSA
jgi:hypothetical protein